MGWDGIGQLALHFPWDPGTKIDEQEIENLLNEPVTRNISAKMIINCELF